MNRGALHLTMSGRECSWLDPSYQRHITFACTGCYQLHLHHRLGIITPASTNFPTPKGWIAWLAKADCTHITFAQGYYTIESKGTRRKSTQVVGSKTNSIPVDQPYFIGRELNLRKLPGLCKAPLRCNYHSMALYKLSNSSKSRIRPFDWQIYIWH